MNQAPKRRGSPPNLPKLHEDLNNYYMVNPDELKRDIERFVKPSERQVGGTHYASKTIQPWDAMSEWMSKEEFVGFLRGNAIKYLARCNDKGGVEDVKKAQHYLEKLLEVLNGQP